MRAHDSDGEAFPIEKGGGVTAASFARHSKLPARRRRVVVDGTLSWEQICVSTDRLCLRTPTLKDAEAMHELFADPVVMHGLNREPVSQLDETRAAIEGGM